MGVWSTSGLSGLYTLRLKVGDNNQAVVHVLVNAGTYVMITSPQDNDTIKGCVDIYGYSVVPGFSNYTLEYGYGDSPSNWLLITASTKMIVDNALGRWVLSYLTPGRYTLRLSVWDSCGNIYRDEAGLFLETVISGGWLRDLSSWGSLSPAVGDVDGDSRNEIVIGVGGPSGWGKTGGVWVYTDRGAFEPGWPKDADKNMMSSPALGDLDGDGIDDIVICSDRGVHAYLSKSANWFRSAGTEGNDFWSLATPVIADLENDGYPEVLTMDNQGIVYAWRYNGQSVIPNQEGVFAQTTECDKWMGFPSLAVADLDKDGRNEVVAGSARGYGEFGHYAGIGGIYIFDIRGNLLLSPQNYSAKFSLIYGIAIANVDSTEDLEVIAFGQNENHLTLCAFKKDGTQAAGYPVILEDPVAGWWYGNHPAVGDLDADGEVEIVASIWTIGEARIYAWHQNGMPLNPTGPLVFTKSADSVRKRIALSNLGSNLGEISAKITSINKEGQSDLVSAFKDTVFASEAETFGDPVLADVNGDGSADIVIRSGNYFNNGYERVFAWDYEGNLIPGWPLYSSSEASVLNYLPYSPVITDLDKDGKLSLILGADWPKYRLIFWKFDTGYHRSILQWPKYMHDKWNSGNFLKDLQPPESIIISSSDSLSMTLRWTPSDFATSYEIFRKSWVAGDTLNLIATTSDTMVIDSSINILPDFERRLLFYGIRARYFQNISTLSRLVSKFDQELHSNGDLWSFNTISLPLVDENIKDARSLAGILPSSKAVCWWDVPSQRFLKYDPHDSTTNFRVSPGLAFGSFQSSNANWTLTGSLITGPISLKTSLICDFNLITVPLTMSDSFTAAELCRIIPCNSIAFWDPAKQSFVQYVPRFDFKDFPIRPGYPYFVSVSYNTVWNYFSAFAGSAPEYPGIEATTEIENTSLLNVRERVHAPHLVCGHLNRPADSITATIEGLPGFRTSSNSAGSGMAGDRWFLQIGSPYYGWKWGDIALVKIFSGGEVENLKIGLSWNLVDSTTALLKDAQLPKDFSLSQNFPNPFNAVTAITYGLPYACHVKLQVFNILGQRVRTLINELEKPGYKQVYWDGKDGFDNPVASGIYFYKIKTEDFAETRKMVLMK